MNIKQLEILKHANRPESHGQFVGESPEMDELVERGMMKDIGRPSWCPDTFYQITQSGRDFLKSKSNQVIIIDGREITVRLRYACGSYHASALGCRASCTASPEAAIRALVPKLIVKLAPPRQ